MKKQIYDEKNGLSYTLHGDYYLPDLEINEEEPAYGKYGMMRDRKSVLRRIALIFPFLSLEILAGVCPVARIRSELVFPVLSSCVSSSMMR